MPNGTQAPATAGGPTQHTQNQALVPAKAATPALASNLRDMVRYAEELANAQLLPGQYRRQPANVLYAMEYGRTLGITPIAAITGIHVVEGKPTASAALISGLVRRAGHKLRVRGNDKEAWAQIIRSDDPDYDGYQVTWTMDRARQAGLANKSVWKQYPAAMLKARAITEVARDACEEVLFGLHYTPEELGENVNEDGVPVSEPASAPPQGGMVRVGNMVIDSECFVPHPEGQAIAEKAKDAKDRAEVKARWAEAVAAEVINSGINALDTGQPDVLGDYLKRVALTLPDVAPIEDDVQDAEIVNEPSGGEGDPEAARQERNAA
ncbi:hypothetical protein [Streptomyces sp. NPDC048611]|uniref:hypothetical protein n=1 Tax=Streptomyces sp. NPDC048611 TaxID=3155635 RepID=UPI00343DB19F